MSDDEFMREAIQLAARGRGTVEPNPMVGALVVRDGVVVGRGWHQQFGGPHAETIALHEAGDKARSATLYVTLEPCCHHGKTPPCTDAISKSGVAKVVAAMLDPFAQVAGKGVEQLRSSGIEVAVGAGEPESRWLNRPYVTLLEKRRPYVHLKWAMTLDGKIATSSGESQWISGSGSRKRVHELRGTMDAIIVGSGTVRRDDPLLTARPAGPRTPSRVVLSRRAELPAGCKLLRTVTEAPVVVATTATGSIPAAEVLKLPSDENGYPSLPDLLIEFGKRRLTNVLVEGGPTVLGSFLDARLVDEVHVFIAPKLIGGAKALSAVAGRGIEKIAEAFALTKCEYHPSGEDVYIHGWM